jgi:hypothetical protein
MVKKAEKEFTSTCSAHTRSSRMVRRRRRWRPSGDLVYPDWVPTSSMIDQIEELLRAGHWLGPAVLGVLCCRLLIDAPMAAAGDDIAGVVLLGTSGALLTAAGLRLNKDQHAAVAPLVFGAMFLASWAMR